MIGKKVIVQMAAEALKGYVEVHAVVVETENTGGCKVMLSNGQRFVATLHEIQRVLPEEFPNIKRMERYLRKEDMSPDGKLCMVMEDDGDICLSIIRGNNGRNRDVQFCSVGSGGGKSRHTLAALRNLMKAMELDNEETPL